MASPRQLTARGGTLVLGGGFAGAYVARLLGRRGVDDRLAAELDALHAAAPRGCRGHARAAPRRRAACARCARTPSSCSVARPPLDLAARTVAAETIAGPAVDHLRAARRRARRRPRGSSRCRDSSSTAAASRISPTRSRSATTCSSGSRLRPQAGPPRSSASSSSARATPVSRRSPSCTISRRRRCATTRHSVTRLNAGCSSTLPRRSSPTSRGASGPTPPAASSGAGSRSTSARRCSSYDGEAAVLSDGSTVPARTLVWTAGVKPSPLLERVRASPRRTWPRSRRRHAPGRGPATTSGRSATARGPERAHARDTSIRRPASTRFARRGACAKNLAGAEPSRTATACSARWRRSADTRGSPT